NIQAIEWLDASHRIRWIRPLEGNEPAVGFHYPDDHPNLPHLQIASATDQPVLSNQFELVQGGAGLAYQIPLYRDAGGNPQFDGYLIAIFRAEDGDQVAVELRIAAGVAIQRDLVGQPGATLDQLELVAQHGLVGCAGDLQMRQVRMVVRVVETHCWFVSLQWVDPAYAMAGVQPLDGLDVVEVLKDGVRITCLGRGVAPVIVPAPRHAL